MKNHVDSKSEAKKLRGLHQRDKEKRTEECMACLGCGEIADEPCEELMYELQEFFHHPLYGDDPEDDLEKLKKILASYHTEL